MSTVAISTGTKWRPVMKIWATVATLSELSIEEQRDLEREKTVAKEANDYLHGRDNQDFMLCAHIKASTIFTTRYYPQCWLNGRDDLLPFAQKVIPTPGPPNKLETPTRSDEKEVDTYLYGFYLGSELGYPEELGEQWYLLLGSESGFRYVPISGLDSVLGCSF